MDRGTGLRREKTLDRPRLSDETAHTYPSRRSPAPVDIPQGSGLRGTSPHDYPYRAATPSDNVVPESPRDVSTPIDTPRASPQPYFRRSPRPLGHDPSASNTPRSSPIPSGRSTTPSQRSSSPLRQTASPDPENDLNTSPPEHPGRPRRSVTPVRKSPRLATSPGLTTTPRQSPRRQSSPGRTVRFEDETSSETSSSPKTSDSFADVEMTEHSGNDTTMNPETTDGTRKGVPRFSIKMNNINEFTVWWATVGSEALDKPRIPAGCAKIADLYIHRYKTHGSTESKVQNGYQPRVGDTRENLRGPNAIRRDVQPGISVVSREVPPVSPRFRGSQGLNFKSPNHASLGVLSM